MSRIIPSELVWEILSRLPVSPLLLFKRVCKAWRNMIDDPDFINHHLDRQLLQSQDFSNGVGHLVIRVNAFGRFLLPVGSLNSDFVELTALYHSAWNKNFTLRYSCNGVMLFTRCERKNSTVVSILWNPSTGESRELPPRSTAFWEEDRNLEFYFSSGGFGYDSSSDDYKVVDIMFHHGRSNIHFESEAMVCSLKSNTWRRIKDCPYLIQSSEFGIFLNGALHWIVISTITASLNHLIVGLDLGTEDYFEVKFPKSFNSTPHLYCGGLSKHPPDLCVLGGRIALSYINWLMDFDVWLMNDYKVENSWTKLLSFGGWDKISRPIIYSKDRGQIVLDNTNEVLCLELENRSSKKRITIDGYYHNFINGYPAVQWETRGPDEFMSFAHESRLTKVFYAYKNMLPTVHVESLVRLNGGR